MGGVRYGEGEGVGPRAFSSRILDTHVARALRAWELTELRSVDTAVWGLRSDESRLCFVVHPMLVARSLSKYVSSVSHRRVGVLIFTLPMFYPGRAVDATIDVQEAP